MLNMQQDEDNTLEISSFIIHISGIMSDVISCHAFKLGISSEQDAQCSEQDARTTARISPLLILRFKCRTAYQQGYDQDWRPKNRKIYGFLC